MVPRLRRQATSDESRLYGASVMGVGAGALVFHASSGPARSWGRKLDYWMIALSTAALTKVLHPNVSQHRTGASLLLTPVQPLAVTSANTIGMEVCGTCLDTISASCADALVHLLCVARMGGSCSCQHHGK